MFNQVRNREDLYRRFHNAGFKVGCEIGVHAGNNALAIFKNIPGVKLFLVEPYKDHPCSIAKWGEYNKGKISSHENARIRAYELLKDYDCEWLEMFSEEAIKKVSDSFLDFTHVDGEHFYDFAMLDIILWTRKVRVGGVVSGHDYDMIGVQTAVNNYVAFHGFELGCTQEVKSPSWFFIKT